MFHHGYNSMKFGMREERRERENHVMMMREDDSKLAQIDIILRQAKNVFVKRDGIKMRLFQRKRRKKKEKRKKKDDDKDACELATLYICKFVVKREV